MGNPTQQDESQQIGDAASTGSLAPVPASEPVPGPSSFRNSGPHVQLQDPQLNKPRSAHCCITRITTPIADLRPYNNMVISRSIRARVTNKSSIIPWSNAGGEGVRFSMDLLDETSEITCTAFSNECERFHDEFESGKVYHIVRFHVQLANKRFNHLKNKYKIIIRHDTTIFPCYGNSTKIPTPRCNFSPISEIYSNEQRAMIDVLGVCESYTDVFELLSKASRRKLRKRNVNLIDESKQKVSLTLWGNQADQFDGSSNPVVAVKRARITEYKGKKYLTPYILEVDPDIPEAHRLRGWYNTTGCSDNVRVISKGIGAGSGALNGPWLTFKESKDMQLGCKEGPDYFVVKATINTIGNKNSLYKACPANNCKKKLVELSNGMYRCEICNREYPNFKYQLLLRDIKLADWTDDQQVKAFNEEGEKLIGLSAQNDDEFYEKLEESAYKTFMFKLRVEMENFWNENKLKTTIVAVLPLDLKAYNSHLILKIKELSNMGDA